MPVDRDITMMVACGTFGGKMHQIPHLDPPPPYLTAGPSGLPYTGFCSSEGRWGPNGAGGLSRYDLVAQR